MKTRLSSQTDFTQGDIIPSELVRDVSYVLERQLGEGGMARAYFAKRYAPTGVTSVVLKITRPENLIKERDLAATSYRKEAIALGRLNEQVPPNPFVVRLIDTGEHDKPLNGVSVRIPWLALEYVHGGPEGTTLFQRMQFSLKETKSAFHAARVAHAIQCIASGLGAIHEVGVVHRDLSPSNVLCCGFGDSEIFKIADFGISKAEGVRGAGNISFSSTGYSGFGTPGYSAPEQTFKSPQGVGPFSDVFSLGALTFYLLTGEDYFPSKTAVDCMVQVRSSELRRRLIDCPGLCEELKSDPNTCKALDEIIEFATQPEANKRPQRASALATMLVPWLSSKTPSHRTHARRVESALSLTHTFNPKHWSWNILNPGKPERIIQSAAWDGDGHCLVATTQGLEFWNGENWVDAKGTLELNAKSAQLVHRIGPGEWLLSDQASHFAVYSALEQPSPISSPRQLCQPVMCDGDPDDLMVSIGMTPSGPILQACSAGRWLKPISVDALYLADCARVGDEEWLVVGRSKQNTAFIASYRPLLWELQELSAPAGKPLVAVSASSEYSTGLCVGSEGLVLRYTTRPNEPGSLSQSVIEGSPHLSASAVDILGREWAASLGKIWVRDLASAAAPNAQNFNLSWEDPRLSSPFMSLYAGAGMLFALTVNGAIIEGRSASSETTQRSKASGSNNRPLG